MRIIKRNGEETQFDDKKITDAINGANAEVLPKDRLTDVQIASIVGIVQGRCEELGHSPSVDEIQNMVENELMASGAFEVARRYITYRYTKDEQRRQNTTDDKILALVNGVNEEAEQENANKNPQILSTQRDYIAGEVSRDMTERLFLDKEIVDAHNEGIIHFHDSDYFVQREHNCSLVNLNDMLQNGTFISGTLIEKPHTFSTACNITAQIMAQVASAQYGGQSISLAHLAPFVDEARQRFRKQVEGEYSQNGVELTDSQLEHITEMRVRQDVAAGVQCIQYQLITMQSTQGQAPFSTLYMDLNEANSEDEKRDLAMVIEEVLRQRYQGVKNAAGAWVSPAFPKLIYVLDECNIHEDAPYYYLTKIAAKCTAKRLVPDYISAKKMREYKIAKGQEVGNVYPCMGCRSFLTPDRSGNGFSNIAQAGDYQEDTPKYYGRFNQGVVTINLPDVALSANGDMDKFWQIFEERLELCHRALRARHEHLRGTLSDAAPILWQAGALARLPKGATIDPLLYGGYSTISLGYAGLYECVKAMTGKSHTDEETKPFALSIMQYMNDKCTQWKEAENIDYSLYGTPIESTTYKFAKNLQRRFGIIEGVTDHQYITNSYHVNVREDIDAFTKLKFESEFQVLSPGGAISYVEVPNLQDNLEVVLDIMKYIYDNIMYAELNTKSDYCQVCNYDGEVKIVEDDGKLIWECPNCGNRDREKMNIVRRVCGYLANSYAYNQGRTEEIHDRVLHIDDTVGEVS